MPSRLLASLLGVLVLGGCAAAPVEVAVHQQQPRAFPHRTHLAYFSSGQHRSDKIAMHLEILGEAEPPAELAEGRCTACHDDLAERTACAGCHLLFQDASLRARKEARPCIGCHGGAWVGAAATIPDGTVCAACHGGAPPSGKPATPVWASWSREDAAQAQAAPATDLPWVQLNTVAPNVYFSHSAHVRFARLSCTRCHPDPSGLTAPVASVRAVSMSECLRCHEESGASTDCLTCHK